MIPSFYILVFFTPLMGRVAPGTLSILALILPLLILFNRKQLKSIIWGAPLLGVYLGWLLVLFKDGLGLQGIEILLTWTGISGIYDWLNSDTLNGFGWFLSFRNLLILLLSFGVVSVYQKGRDKFLISLLLGAFIASISLVLDNYGVISAYLPKANIHWETILRFSGLFADPNAAGIFLGLIIPFILPGIFGRDIFKTIIGIAIISAGLISGSRSFIIALSLSIFLFIPKANLRKIIAGGVVVLLFILAIFARYYEEPYVKAASYLPRSMERAALTLVNSEGNDSLESRTLFGRMAYEMFLDYPICGVGPNGFRGHFHEYEKRIGINLEGWEDNSNNYYLGILAELGLVGVIGLVLSVIGLKINPNSRREERHAALILILLLILGPHFDFVEVAIESGVILGLAFVPRFEGVVLTTRNAVLALILSGLVVFSGSFDNLGVYKVASTSDNARWTSVRARPTMPCKEGVSLIQFEAHHASESTPVKVSLSSKNQVFNEILTSREARSVSFACSGEKMEVDILTEPPFRPENNNNKRPNKIIFGVNILNYPLLK